MKKSEIYKRLRADSSRIAAITVTYNSFADGAKSLEERMRSASNQRNVIVGEPRRGVYNDYDIVYTGTLSNLIDLSRKVAKVDEVEADDVFIRDELSLEFI